MDSKRDSTVWLVGSLRNCACTTENIALEHRYQYYWIIRIVLDKPSVIEGEFQSRLISCSNAFRVDCLFQ